MSADSSTPFDADELMDAAWVCKRLGISRRSLYRMLLEHPPALSYLRVGPKGRRYKFRRGAIEAYISRREVKN